MKGTKLDLTREEWVALVDKNKDSTTIWQEDWVRAARDRLHNLDLSITEHKEIYESHLRTHIMFNEITWYTDKQQVPSKPNIPCAVYNDTAYPPRKTIGIGFNMDDPAARRDWKNVFGDKLSFDYVYDEDSKNTITNSQALKLLDYQINKFRTQLQHFFGRDWDSFTPNEKVTIESLYFNSHTLVRHYDGKSKYWDTNFSRNLRNYIKTSNSKYLKQAINEVKYKSNKRKKVGVQVRMDRESLMLESYKCPVYSKPNDNPIPDNILIKIEPGKTVIPRVGKLLIDENDTDNRGNNKQYYIWRTRADGKVRLKHEFYEGKIFHIDHPPIIGRPGDDFNCRCKKDFNIPDFVQIEAKSEQKMIRKYTSFLLDLPDFCIK